LEGWNVRSNPKPDAEMIESVRKVGVTIPIMVRFDEGGKRLLLINGERRYRAALAAGVKTVTVINYGYLDDYNATILSLTADENQKPLTKKEKMKGFKRLADIGLTAGEIAEVMGVDKSTVRVYLTAGKASKRMAEAAEKPTSKGGVSPKVAARAAKLPQKEQDKLVPKVKGKSQAEGMDEVRKAEEKVGRARRVSLQQPKSKPLGRGPEPLTGRSEPPKYRLVADYKERCQQLENAIKLRLENNKNNKILQAQLRIIDVLRGKMQVKDLFPSYV